MKSFIHLFTSLTLIALLSGCLSDSSEAPPAPPTPEVSYIEVQPQTVSLTSELKGRTVASQSSDIRPQVGGIIQQRLFEEGSQVNAGDVLYQIDPASYQAALQQAKANLKSAKAALESARLTDKRYAGLVTIQGISQQDADDAHTTWLEAEAALASARAALVTANINLGYTRITAPISGRIGLSSVTPGALVDASQSTALASINTLDPMYVDMTQSSKDQLLLRKLLQQSGIKTGSTRVSLILEDGSRYEHQGTLKVREVAVNEDTGSVTLRAEFANPDGLLLPGMFVRAVVEDAVNHNAILLPQQGISHDSQGHAVALLLNDKNQVEKRIVTTERAIGNQWLVSAGVEPGDKLIVEGTSKIQAGNDVIAVKAQVNDDGSIKLSRTDTNPDDHTPQLASE
jgi:membrane fusion protein (multidrug efflux system)